MDLGAFVTLRLIAATRLVRGGYAVHRRTERILQTYAPARDSIIPLDFERTLIIICSAFN